MLKAIWTLSFTFMDYCLVAQSSFYCHNAGKILTEACENLPLIPFQKHIDLDLSLKLLLLLLNKDESERKRKWKALLPGEEQVKAFHRNRTF